MAGSGRLWDKYAGPAICGVALLLTGITGIAVWAIVLKIAHVRAPTPSSAPIILRNPSHGLPRFYTHELADWMQGLTFRHHFFMPDIRPCYTSLHSRVVPSEDIGVLAMVETPLDARMSLMLWGEGLRKNMGRLEYTADSDGQHLPCEVILAEEVAVPQDVQAYLVSSGSRPPEHVGLVWLAFPPVLREQEYVQLRIRSPDSVIERTISIQGVRWASGNPTSCYIPVLEDPVPEGSSIRTLEERLRLSARSLRDKDGKEYDDTVRMLVACFGRRDLAPSLRRKLLGWLKEEDRYGWVLSSFAISRIEEQIADDEKNSTGTKK